MAERAGEELPAKATSLALRLSLVPNAPNVTCYPLVSSYNYNAWCARQHVQL